MTGKMNIAYDWQPPDDHGVHKCYREAMPDMTFRWCSDRIRQRFGMESWVPTMHMAFDHKTGVGDPSPPGPGGQVRRGDSFLCHMPKKFKEQRTEYYTRRNNERIEAIRKDSAAAVASAKLRAQFGLTDGEGVGEGRLDIGVKADMSALDPKELDEQLGIIHEGQQARADANLDDLLEDDD